MVERGAPLRSAALGSSMAPFIRDHDILTIAPLGDRRPQIGDVVAFARRGGDRLLIHRVVAHAGDGWRIRGDSAWTDDGVASRDEILGRVVRVERGRREVRLGVARGSASIAVLSRSDVLAAVRGLTRSSRRVVAATLRRAQGLATYRTLGRSLHVRCDIGAATEEELQAVQRRLDPGGASTPRGADPNVGDRVARRGGKVVGYVQHVYHPGDHAPWVGHWLFSLTVWGRYRGLGVGEALTRQVIHEARDSGAEELLLAVFDDNARAIRLYRKLGFEHVVVPGLEPGFAEEKARYGRRRIVLRKDLRAEDGAA
jgi:ribosomal protein S18 acetylase RimI-like enzyme